MSIKRIGQFCVALGIAGITLSVLVDNLPQAKAGIQAAQILGIEVSAVILVLGIGLLRLETDDNFDIRKYTRRLIERVLSLPVLDWVLIGFLIVYVLFFIFPLFLNDTLRIKYFTTYLPDRYPIGNDLIAVLDLMKGWFFDGKSPYEVQFYPPFTYVFFAPLLLVGDYPSLFSAFTLASVFFYILLTLVLPLKIVGRENLPMILLLFLPGLVSYGFQFELERGQYNVLTFLLCLLAIYIFHTYPRHRILAYLLFTVSIQLKLYPAIFIVMFVDDWRNWKAVLQRFIGLGVVNFLLLFIMGRKIFSEFIRSVTSQISSPGWGWNGNHSIKAFVGNLAKDGFGVVSPRALAVIQENSDLLGTLLLVLFLIIYLSTILLAYLKNKPGIDTYLLVTCMIGALIIPISNDYTLSMLTAPMILFLSNLNIPQSVRHKIVYIPLTLGISLAYSSILIPFKFKPYFLNNAFPPLFLILIFVTLLNLMEHNRRTIKASIKETA
ncbi:MAG: glycosyltransferase family 87 protein [Chloroflexota bacterium]